MQRFLLLASVLLSLVTVLNSQATLLSPRAELAPAVAAAADLPTDTYEVLALDRAGLEASLATAPAERAAGGVELYLDFPTPGGGAITVRIEESSVMHPNLAARYPELKSYVLQGPYGSGRLAVTPNGLTASIIGPEGEYFITPAARGNDVEHLIYYVKDIDLSMNGGNNDLSCGWDPDAAREEHAQYGLDLPGVNALGGRSSSELIGMFVYDLALTCTGEFALIHGGSVSGVMAAFNEAVTVLNATLERETASRFILIEDNDLLIFTDPNSDPYTNANSGSGLLGQVATAIATTTVDLDDFDLGHLFTGGCNDVGGVVSGLACTNGKTRGVTCNSNSNVASVVRRIMTHEVAHQFAVSHTWNNCPSSQNQRASGTAFEPGSGSTIMSYAGLCGPNNVVNDNDDYYHVGSLDQFYQYTRIVTPECATQLTPVNNTPEITLDYEDGFFIPISTPFVLTGSATDQDNDNLTYCWEQYDLGPPTPLGEPEGNAPSFRSFEPDEDGHTRYLPRLNDVITNTNNIREVLPTYSRDLTFRFTVRDNNPDAGASVWETVAFEATEEAGPFLVTFPNDGTETFSGGQYVEVLWDVANTDQAPVNCQLVNITLSLNGGLTYPVTLLENTFNDGAAFVTIPADLTAGNARVRVEAADNIFYDISNNSFPIVAPTEPGFTLQGPQFFENVCLPESVTATFESTGFLGFSDNIELEIREDLLPADVEVSLSEASLIPGESTQVTIDLTESDFDGLLDVVLVASLGDTFSTERVITLDVVNNDFSDLALLTPAEGSNDIQLTTDFSWTAAQYADTYDYQLATSPDFAPENLFDFGTGLTGTTFEQAEFFEVNTVYYWRVRPVNECGPGEWLDPQSFRTSNVDCIDYESTDTPLVLPGSFTERVSELFVDNNGSISDINIPNVRIEFQTVNNLTLLLESPEGTQVVLYQEDCSGLTGILDIGFDDQAPEPTSCPPDDGRVVIPIGALADFNGENTFGTWKLVIQNSTPGSTGGLIGWNIQFCASVNTAPPFLVNNELNTVSPGDGTVVTAQELLVEDNNFGDTQLTYTVVRAPLNGFLRLSGDPIQAGATFTQRDIVDWQLYYFNTNAETNEDDFSFVVQNPDGGYLPVTYHDFLVDVAASNNDPIAAENLPEIFPNPTEGNVQIRWGVSTTEVLPVQLLDVTGRLIDAFQLPARTSTYRLEMSELPAGIYFLRLGKHTERIVKR